MAHIYNTTTREVVELACVVDGIDRLAVALEAVGVPTVMPWLHEPDVECLYALSAEEVWWWRNWVAVRLRIAARGDEGHHR